MQLHHKLILVFSVISLVVLVTGAAGLFVVGKLGGDIGLVLEGKVAVADASSEIITTMASADAILHEYLLTNDPDRLDQIEKEMENYHKIDDMWTRAITYGTESQEFINSEEYWLWPEYGYGTKGIVIRKAGPEVISIIEELDVHHERFYETADRLMKLHREMVVLQQNMTDLYSEEKSQRHRMRDIIRAHGDYLLMDNIWRVEYEGKAFLFQYKDKKHADEWMEAVETLQREVASSTLAPEIKSDFQDYSAEYRSLVRALSRYALELTDLDTEKHARMNVLDGHATDGDANVAEVKAISFAARSDAKREIQANITTMLNFLAVVMAVVIALILSVGYLTNKFISRPIIKLRNATKKTGEGDFDVRIDVDRGDEIGDLGTAFNEMAQALKERTAELEKTQEDLEARAVKLAEYAEQLEHSNKLKDLFTDIMRHDILNPVGIIRNFAEILAENEELKDSEYLHAIWSSARKLEEMIQTASLYAKLESAEDIKWRDMDLNEIIKDAADSLKPYFEGKRIELEYLPKGKYIASTVSIVEEVFVNLLSNAVKYSPENTKVTVDIEDAGKNWRVTVADQGTGVPDEYKKSIFDRFTRKAKNGVRGTGLGLAIVKRIAEMHSGGVWVEDNPMGGSIFYVEMPKAGV